MLKNLYKFLKKISVLLGNYKLASFTLHTYFIALTKKQYGVSALLLCKGIALKCVDKTQK